MADVRGFFESYLPKKIAKNPSLVTDINAVYQFNLGDSGEWVVDLTKEGGEVSEGTASDPGCTVTISGDDFAKLLDKPTSAMMMFTMGKLKVSNMSLGLQLQKLLG